MESESNTVFDALPKFSEPVCYIEVVGVEVIVVIPLSIWVRISLTYVGICEKFFDIIPTFTISPLTSPTPLNKSPIAFISSSKLLNPASTICPVIVTPFTTISAA